MIGALMNTLRRIWARLRPAPTVALPTDHGPFRTPGSTPQRRVRAYVRDWGSGSDLLIGEFTSPREAHDAVELYAAQCVFKTGRMQSLTYRFEHI